MGDLLLVYLYNMVIFHSYVNLPEDIYIYFVVDCIGIIPYLVGGFKHFSTIFGMIIQMDKYICIFMGLVETTNLSYICIYIQLYICISYMYGHIFIRLRKMI